MRTNTTRYVILGLLTEGPLSGYDIKKLVAIRFRFFWSESYGQIYPQLKSLSSEGLIVESGAAGVRAKRVFAITERGRSAFAEWMATPPGTEVMRIELLLKLFWAPWLPRDSVKTYVEQFKNKHKGELADLQHMEHEVRRIVDDAENHWWILKTIELGVQMNTVYLQWADALISEMEEKQ